MKNYPSYKMKDKSSISERSWYEAASDMVDNNTDVIYIGVFALDTFGEIAAYGPDKIIMDKADIAAIVKHMMTSHSILARIKIAGLNFACMNFGCSHMTGMSNFNIDNKAVDEVDQVLKEIANIRYTRQASFEAVHVLTISAFIHDDVVLIGITLCNETTSALKVLKDTLKYKKETPTAKSKDKSKKKEHVSKPLALTKKTSEANSSLQLQATVTETNNETETLETNTEINVETNGESPETQTETTVKTPESVEMTSIGIGDVQRRRSTKAEIERRKDSTKRETEFCEDWRTATIRSIEALRNIGPFSEGTSPTDDDKKPLILSESGYHTDLDRPKSHGTTRRVSRPTMV